MKRFYQAAGISKQCFHHYLKIKTEQHIDRQRFLPLIDEIREEYPTMSAREMHRLIKPPNMGRDRFEAFCFEAGYRVVRKRAYHRTTNSLGVTRFPNLISELELKGVNHVWVSDITYYRIQERFYYLTFIIDRFTRLIVGHSVSQDLFVENTTIPALAMATKRRKGVKPEIFHSDGGGQYYSKAFLKLTGKNVQNSMGECAYDNPHAERVNGLIKNDYLSYYSPKNFKELQDQTARAVSNYNNKHHSSIRTSPVRYEQLSTNEQMLTKKKSRKKRKINIKIINS